MACGIYKITNQINQKVYIGQSKNVERRWQEHKETSLQETSNEYNYPLYCAIRKYGLENFTFEIIEECPQEKLNSKEEYYISLYESYPVEHGKGYNQTPGGSNFGFNKKVSEEILALIIDYLKNTYNTQGEIAKIFNLTNKHISDINVGRTWRLDGVEYPIRERKLSYAKKHFNSLMKVSKCTRCDSIISHDNKSGLCRRCYLLQRKQCVIERIELKNNLSKGPKHALKIHLPPKEDLLKDLYELKKDYLVAEKYGISTMLLKDWKIELGIPRKRPLVDRLYEEEYLHIPPKEEKPKNPNYMAPINQLDKKTGELIQTFDSPTQAAKYIQENYQSGNKLENISTCIHNCLKGQIKTACGFKWRYSK